MSASLVGSEMCIRDRTHPARALLHQGPGTGEGEQDVQQPSRHDPPSSRNCRQLRLLRARRPKGLPPDEAGPSSATDEPVLGLALKHLDIG
eukprot:7494633-Alexandrium_andersonii.AAC.1